VADYEYLVLNFGREVQRSDIRRTLTDHAEYGHWELARTRTPPPHRRAPVGTAGAANARRPRVATAGRAGAATPWPAAAGTTATTSPGTRARTAAGAPAGAAPRAATARGVTG